MTTDEKAKAYEMALEAARKELLSFIKSVQHSYLCATDRRDKWIAYLEKQKEQIPYIDFVIKPHKGDDNNPYDMQVSEAQEYAIKRGFGIPFNDGEVYVDERHMTQTIGNILRWADEHPKEQKPILSDRDFTDFEIEVHEIIAQARNDSRLDDADVLKQFEEEAAFALMLKANKLIEQKPSWSEEDEDALNHLHEFISWGYAEKFMDAQTAHDMRAWINEHLRPQPKPEWSEEDEGMLKSIIWHISYSVTNGKNTDCKCDLTEWLKEKLKSFRPSWKPSEEQISSLKQARDYYMSGRVKYVGRHLSEIAEQLEKLI